MFPPLLRAYIGYYSPYSGLLGGACNTALQARPRCSGKVSDSRLDAQTPMLPECWNLVSGLGFRVQRRRSSPRLHEPPDSLNPATRTSLLFVFRGCRVSLKLGAWHGEAPGRDALHLPLLLTCGFEVDASIMYASMQIAVQNLYAKAFCKSHLH